MKKVFVLVTLAFLHINLMGQIPDEIQKNVEYTLPSGLKIKFTKINVVNQRPKKSDIIEIYYTVKLMDNTLIDNSFEKKKGSSLSFSFGEGKVITGFEEGISYMHIGEKAILTVPPSLGYGDKVIGNIPKNSTLIFDVEIKNISSSSNYYQYVYNIEGFYVKGRELNTTSSGLNYIVVEEGKGEKIKDGDKVSVNYTLYLSNGKKFDSSFDRNKAFAFTVGNKEVIEGFEEGVKLMNVGGKIRLIIPYQLGYGEKEMGTIPPKSTLIFDIEVLSASATQNTISSTNSNTSSGSISATDAFALGVTALIFGGIVNAVSDIGSGDYSSGNYSGGDYSSSSSSSSSSCTFKLEEWNSIENYAQYKIYYSNGSFCESYKIGWEKSKYDNSYSIKERTIGGADWGEYNPDKKKVSFGIGGWEDETITSLENALEFFVKNTSCCK